MNRQNPNHSSADPIPEAKSDVGTDAQLPRTKRAHLQVKLHVWKVASEVALSVETSSASSATDRRSPAIPSMPSIELRGPRSGLQRHVALIKLGVDSHRPPPRVASTHAYLQRRNESKRRQKHQNLTNK